METVNRKKKKEEKKAAQKALKESKEKDKEEKQKECMFYLRNKCKFGKSGKGCNYAHPKQCKDYITKGKEGCNKGKHCVDFHPKLCYKSIHKKEYQREQCRYIHLPRTQRMVIEAGKCKSCDKTPSNGADTRKHMENHMNHNTTPVPSVENLEH